MYVSNMANRVKCRGSWFSICHHTESAERPARITRCRVTWEREVGVDGSPGGPLTREILPTLPTLNNDSQIRDLPTGPSYVCVVHFRLSERVILLLCTFPSAIDCTLNTAYTKVSLYKCILIVEEIY